MDHTGSLQALYDAINAHDADAFCERLADDFVEHEVTPGVPPTKEGTREFFEAYFAAFPDIRFTAEELLAAGDKAVGRARVTGTHTGDFMGIPATGRSCDIQVIDIVRFGDDGRALEHWGVMEELKLMQQLGVVPEQAPA